MLKMRKTPFSMIGQVAIFMPGFASKAMAL